MARELSFLVTDRRSLPTADANLRLVISTLFVLIVGAASGLGMTYFAFNHDIVFGSRTIGSWIIRPEIGTTNADPYARALTARIGRLPTALGDGVSFTAQVDDAGKLLDGRCDVIVSGTTPAARFWTLTLHSRSGELIANSLHRHGFTSREIVRQANGDFSIAVGPRASAGNWLPTNGIERYILVLRLYDTPVRVATKSDHEIVMPAIAQRSCP